MKLSEEFLKGIWKENPVLVLILGMCPSLATSSNAVNGMGMGLATTFVLLCSNVVISAVRTIGFVFQGFHLIPGLDALENVELPLLYRGMGRDERRRLAADSLEQVGLGNRLHHRPGEMSGGQQQRVAIARAIAAKPPIILADEPTGNLDSRSGREVMALLHALHREGHTVILITHDPAIASEANRRICIHEGEIVSEKTAGWVGRA